MNIYIISAGIQWEDDYALFAMTDKAEADERVAKIDVLCDKITQHICSFDCDEEYGDDETYKTLRKELADLGGFDEYHTHYVTELKLTGEVDRKLQIANNEVAKLEDTVRTLREDLAEAHEYSANMDRAVRAYYNGGGAK